VRVIRALQRSAEPQALSEITARVDLHKTTTLRIVRTLYHERFVYQDEPTGHYACNPGFWVVIGGTLRPAFALLRDIDRILNALAANAEATALILVPDETGRHGVSAAHATPTVPLRLSPADLPVTPLHTATGGMCYLAHCSPEALAAYREAAQEAKAEQSSRAPADLDALLEAIRSQDHAAGQDDTIPDVVNLAVPLRESTGPAVGALVLALPASRTCEEAIEIHLPPLRDAAAEISQMLGHESWTARVAGMDPSLVTPKVTSRGMLLKTRVPEHWPQGPVQSVSRMIRLVGLLACSPRGASLADMRRQLEVPAAATSRIVHTLAADEVVRQDAARRRYHIHPLFWLRMAPTLGIAFSSHEMTRRALAELAELVGFTAALVTPDGAGSRARVVDHARPDRPVSWDPERTLPLPLHATAAGKCYLAHQPHTRVTEYIEAGLEAVTAHTIASPEPLKRELAAVRQQGYAVSREEAMSGACGIAVPILDSSGRVVGSLSVAPLIDEFVDADVPDVVELLHGFAVVFTNRATVTQQPVLDQMFDSTGEARRSGLTAVRETPRGGVP
jgi:DNA-binding IclR family transcriptional regulator